MPDISVLMSVFNGQKYLADAIESILAQTHSRFEFIIVDDGSRDVSREIILKYAATDSRIVPVLLECNAGLAAALNKGLAMAKADVIARMDCDDRALPHRLATQLKHMNDLSLDLVGSLVYRIDDKGKRFGVKKLPTDFKEIEKILPKKNCFIHPSVIFKKRLIDRVGGYSEGFLNSQDYDLWLRILPEYKLGNVPEYLLEYRYHSYKSVEKMDVYKQTYFSVLAALSFLARRYNQDTPKELFLLDGLSDWINSLYRRNLSQIDTDRLHFHAFRYLKNCSSNEHDGAHAMILKNENLAFRYRTKLYFDSLKAFIKTS